MISQEYADKWHTLHAIMTDSHSDEGVLLADHLNDMLADASHLHDHQIHVLLELRLAAFESWAALVRKYMKGDPINEQDLANCYQRSGVETEEKPPRETTS